MTSYFLPSYSLSHPTPQILLSCKPHWNCEMWWKCCPLSRKLSGPTSLDWHRQGSQLWASHMEAQQFQGQVWFSPGGELHTNGSARPCSWDSEALFPGDKTDHMGQARQSFACLECATEREGVHVHRCLATRVLAKWHQLIRHPASP